MNLEIVLCLESTYTSLLDEAVMEGPIEKYHYYVTFSADWGLSKLWDFTVCKTL